MERRWAVEKFTKGQAQVSCLPVGIRTPSLGVRSQEGVGLKVLIMESVDPLQAAPITKLPKGFPKVTSFA